MPTTLESITAEHDLPLDAPIPILNLSPGRDVDLHHVIRTKLRTRPVRATFQTFHEIGDRSSADHSLLVGIWAAGILLEAGDHTQDVGLAAEGGFVHDVGKTDPALQHVLVSPERFAHNDGHRRHMQGHVRFGGQILRRNGASENLALAAEYHHGFQTTRPAYDHTGEISESPQLVGTPEGSSGRVPNILRVVQAITVADHWTAMQDSSRRYLGGNTFTPDQTIAELRTLRVDQDLVDTLQKIA